MNKILKISLIIFFVFEICAIPGVAEDKGSSSLSVEFHQGTLAIEANRVPLGEILDGILRKCQVKIQGLEQREKESLTFSSGSGTVYEALRRLFSHLDEGNYAFEFHDQELVRVLVLPETKGEALSMPVRKATETIREEVKQQEVKQQEVKQQEVKQEFVTVPKILHIDEGSQAEILGLLKGDLIVEYDGVEIRASNQLLGEVKKKSDMEQVEIIVIREQKSLQFTLKGGKIGAGVGDVKIPKEEFDAYLE
jgi:preprotein translocase subunit SecD